MTLMVGVCFISIGARKVVKINEYSEWIISLNNEEIPIKKELQLNISQLKQGLLKVILDAQKRDGFVDKNRLFNGNLGKNQYFQKCFDDLVNSFMIEEIKKNKYIIPPSKLNEVKNLIELDADHE